MSKLLKLPNGDAIANYVLRSVQYYEGKSVVCKDAQQRIVAYIKEPNTQRGMRIRDLLIKVVDDGNAFTQPDWSFLTETNN